MLLWCEWSEYGTAIWPCCVSVYVCWMSAVRCRNTLVECVEWGILFILHRCHRLHLRRRIQCLLLQWWLGVLCLCVEHKVATGMLLRLISILLHRALVECRSLGVLKRTRILKRSFARITWLKSSTPLAVGSTDVGRNQIKANLVLECKWEYAH